MGGSSTAAYPGRVPGATTSSAMFLGVPTPVALAHRGGAGEAPENSWTAYEHAQALGYRVIETDLRATSDGVCLTFHDARLDRVTDARGRVRDQPWRAVRDVRLADGGPIPRLDEVLDALPEVVLNVDIKEAAAIAPLVDVLARTRATRRVCITSFSGTRLRSARRALGRSVATALAPDEVASVTRRARGHPGDRARTAIEAGAVAAQVPERVGGRRLVTPGFVEAAHAAGLQVHVWTVDEPADMVRLLELGVDGIMTDRPTVLRDVLMPRGAWTTGRTQR